jgi:putative tributyrin esterase
MAYTEFHFFSNALGKATAVNVIVPEMNDDERLAAAEGKLKFQTLYLYHGHSDDGSIWCRRTSIERYADGYRLAVVMPDVAKSWYTNMAHGDRYFDFVADELPRVMRAYFPLSAAREDNFVAGLSMGGYGAFKTALTYPERYAGAMSLSGCLGFGLGDDGKFFEGRPAFREVFGDKMHGTENDLGELLRRDKEKGAVMPKMIHCCGTEDFLLEDNRRFRDYAASLGFDIGYYEEPGTHEWGFWDRNIRVGLKFFELKGKPVTL